MKITLQAFIIAIIATLLPIQSNAENFRNHAPIIKAKLRPIYKARRWIALRTQRERGEVIIGHFETLIGRIYPNDEFNCKTAPQVEMSELTGGLIKIPLTSPDYHGYSWQPSHQFLEIKDPILENLQIGDFLQMRYHRRKSFTPHTAIFKSWENGEICLIDNGRNKKRDKNGKPLRDAKGKHIKLPYRWEVRCYNEDYFLRKLTNRTTGKQEWTIYRPLQGVKTES